METPTFKWRTRDGQVLSLEDMKSPHIENCIKMLQRHIDNRKPDAVSMGDSDAVCAAVDCENRSNDIAQEEYEEQIEILKGELQSRSLTPTE